MLVIAAKPGYDSVADFCGTDDCPEVAHPAKAAAEARDGVLSSLAGTGAAALTSRPLGTTPARDPGGRPDGSKGRRCSRHVLLHLEYDDDPDSP